MSDISYTQLDKRQNQKRLLVLHKKKKQIKGRAAKNK